MIAISPPGQDWLPYPDSNRGFRLRTAALSPLSYTALAAGIRFERTHGRLTAACPTGWATLLSGPGGWDRTSDRRAPNAECSHCTTPGWPVCPGAGDHAARRPRPAGIGGPLPCAPTHACFVEEARGLAPQTPRGATCFRDRLLVWPDGFHRTPGSMSLLFARCALTYSSCQEYITAFWNCQGVYSSI
jgi:hypothetical protein